MLALGATVDFSVDPQALKVFRPGHNESLPPGTIMDGVIDAIWRRPSGGRLAVVGGNGISRDYWEVEELNNGELHREVERARGSTLVSARKLYTCHGPRGETRSVAQMLDLALEFNQLLRPGPGRRKGHAANKYCQVRLGSIVA